MTDDFVTRLGVALRDAADRDERRASAVARAGDRAHPRCRACGRAWCSPRSSRGSSSPPGSTVWPASAATRTAPAGPRVIARPGAGGRARPDRLGLRVGLVGRHRHPDAAAHGPAHPPRDGSVPTTAGRGSSMPGKGAMWVGLTQDTGVPPAAHRPAHDRIVARLRTPDVAGGVRLQRAGAGRQQPLACSAPSRPCGSTRRAVTPSRRCARPATAIGCDRWRWSTTTCGCRSATGVCCASTAPAAGARPPSRVPDGSLVGDFWMNGLFVVDENALSRMDPRTFHVLWRTPIVSIGSGYRGRRQALGRGARPARATACSPSTRARAASSTASTSASSARAGWPPSTPRSG